jgi:hypothetical protein
MIINLLFWCYITLICLVWGNLFIQVLLKKIMSIPGETELGVVCLAGLAIIGCIAFYFSIFFALDWRAHLLILVPAILYCLSSENRKCLKDQFNRCFRNLSPKSYFFLGSCILMLLLLSSHKIIHPDTLAYHTQSIQWFQKYGVVPGLVHLKLELGFQSIWFAIQALFNPFPDTINLTSSGGCIVCWFLIFIIRKMETVSPGLISFSLKTGNSGWGWILLLIYSLISWTQIRLTAASESPDFIVTLLILSAFYSFYQAGSDRGDKNYYFLLATLFSCTAITGKLSSISISFIPAIICIYFLFRGRYKSLLIFAFFSFAIIIPLLVRNLIVSGYILYPSAYADIFNPDWKLDFSRLHNFQDYITAYARFPIDSTESGKSIALPFSKWIPTWWDHLAIADKVLLSTVFLAGIINMVFLKLFLKTLKRKAYSAIFIVAVSGSLLWFFKAPDPRFGSGFLISLLYILYLPLKGIRVFLIQRIKPILYSVMVWSLGLGVMAYSVYRIQRHFYFKELVIPAGIGKVDYIQINDNKITINLVTDSTGCGLTPVPCIAGDRQYFMPRGKQVSEGFRGR